MSEQKIVISGVETTRANEWRPFKLSSYKERSSSSWGHSDSVLKKISREKLLLALVMLMFGFAIAFGTKVGH